MVAMGDTLCQRAQQGILSWEKARLAPIPDRSDGEEKKVASGYL